MKPSVFPTKKSEKLYDRLVKEGFSADNKFSDLFKYGLASTFMHDGRSYFISPEMKWHTYSIIVPKIAIDQQNRNDRTRYAAMREIAIRWVFAQNMEKEMDENFMEKVRYWIAATMTRYTTFSLPNCFKPDFDRDCLIASNCIAQIKPEIKLTTCSECKTIFVSEEGCASECPECGFTFIQ